MNEDKFLPKRDDSRFRFVRLREEIKPDVLLGTIPDALLLLTPGIELIAMSPLEANQVLVKMQAEGVTRIGLLPGHLLEPLSI